MIKENNMGYDKKIYHSLLTVLATIAIVVIIVVSSYFVIYGANGVTMLKDKDKKAASYANANADVEHGRVIFLGDSITEMCNLDKYYPTLGAVNRGISGDSTQGMLDRLESNVISISPQKLIILGGTNDLDRDVTPRQVADNINKIIEITQDKLPNCKIYVQSIYPVNSIRKPTFLNKVYSRTNENISLANDYIYQVCQEKGCIYIDVNSHLKDSSGNLKNIYSKDGLHLTHRGYEQVARIVAPYINDLS